MKLNCKRIDLPYTPGEEIFTFPEDTGLPFLFDVEEELTADPAAMDAVGEMLDETEKLAEKLNTIFKRAALYCIVRKFCWSVIPFAISSAFSL